MGLAIFIYAISDCLIKHTVMVQFHLSQVIFIRALMRLIPMLIIASFMQNGLAFYLKTRRIKAHAIRLIFSVMNTVSFMLAIQYTCLVNVYTMSYATAIFTTIFGYVFLKESVGTSLWMAVLIGLLGTVIALQPHKDLLSNLGSIIALSGAFFAAMNKVCMRDLSRTEHSLTITIYPNIAVVVLCLPVASYFWKAIPADQFPYFISIGILSATAQYLIARALSLSNSSALAPLDYTSYVWVFMLDFITMGITPGGHNLIGVSLIMLSGIFVYYRAKQA